jgi:SAM-dependent methyltransferase
MTARSQSAAAGTGATCPACLGARYDSAGEKGGCALRVCRGCGTISAEAVRVETASIDALYDHYYDGAEFGLPPASGLALEELVRSFEPFRTDGRWMDMGFGEGGVLRLAERAGWACSGVERSPRALAFGRERGWTVADSADDFPAGVFDVVTMIELIEHVPQPDGFFAAAARLLRPGGVLYVTTPNARSLNARVLGTVWSVVSPPEHLTIWAAAGARAALERSGFRVERIRTTGLNPSEMLRRARPAAEGAAPSRNDVAFAMNAAMTSSPVRRRVKAGVNACLSAFGVGDSLKVWALRRGPADR